MDGEKLQDISRSSPPKIACYIPEGIKTIFCGPERSGKTMAGVAQAHNAYLQGRPVFSNIWLNFPHEPLDFSELQLEDEESKFRGSHIFVDELNFLLDARRSSSRTNVTTSAFILQVKKLGCNFSGTTHSLGYVDLRLHDNFDVLIEPKAIRIHPKEPPVILKLVVTNGPTRSPFRKIRFIECSKYFGMYDTGRTYDPFKNMRNVEKKRFSV